MMHATLEEKTPLVDAAGEFGVDGGRVCSAGNSPVLRR
jgi:hypothetical protein